MVVLAHGAEEEREREREREKERSKEKERANSTWLLNKLMSFFSIEKLLNSRFLHQVDLDT